MERNPKVRLNLDINARTNEILQRLANDAGVTKSDVVRRAISLMSIAVEGKREGFKLGLVASDKKLTKEIVGLID